MSSSVEGLILKLHGFPPLFYHRPFHYELSIRLGPGDSKEQYGFIYRHVACDSVQVDCAFEKWILQN